MANPDFTVDTGGNTAPDKFTVRFKGLLVRYEDGKPLLFDDRAAALAAIERLEAEGYDK